MSSGKKALITFLIGVFVWPFALSALYGALGGSSLSAGIAMVAGVFLSYMSASFWWIFSDSSEGQSK